MPQESSATATMVRISFFSKLFILSFFSHPYHQH
jgi:hypothetical protein